MTPEKKSWLEDREIHFSFHVATLNKSIADSFASTLRNESMENLGPLELGLRPSARAIRFLTLLCITDLADDPNSTLFSPNHSQFKDNFVEFGYILGIYSKLEKILMLNGYPVLTKLSKDESDAWTYKTPEKSSILLPKLSMLPDAVRYKSKKGQIYKVLFHGKWNVPHIGHLMFIYDSLKEISRKYKIPITSLLPIVVCERNNYIKSAGSIPFMDTSWRAGLMSLPPFNGIIVAGENINRDEAQQFWGEQYNEIKPDFLPVETDDQITNFKKENARSAGIRVVDMPTSLTPNNGIERISSSLFLGNNPMDYDLFEEQYRRFEQEIGNAWRVKWR